MLLIELDIYAAIFSQGMEKKGLSTIIVTMSVGVINIFCLNREEIPLIKIGL